MPLGTKNLTPGQESVSRVFGERLRQIRLQKGRTQMQVALEFGIDRAYLSDVERGRKSISLPMMHKLASGFQTSLSELLRDIS